MEVVRLRKLTYKSVLPYGKYKGKVVEEVKKSDVGHLVWLYYHVEWLSYVDEVLDDLKIFPEQRIEKPGIDHGKFMKRLIVIEHYKFGDKAKLRHYSIERKRRKQRLADTERCTDFTKGQLEAMNHGHMSNKIYNSSNRKRV